MATELRCSALIPDYRLAPEHPFPAASEDCFRTYRWLLERDVAAGDIVIAGDSAGGNLTLTTLFRVRDAGLPPPACAICLSPGTDLSLGGVTLVSNERRDPMFRLQTLVIMKNAYIGDASPTEPLISAWAIKRSQGTESLRVTAVSTGDLFMSSPRILRSSAAP